MIRCWVHRMKNFANKVPPVKWPEVKAEIYEIRDAGRLTFDASLLGLRDELQDYVIVHDLLHFHVPNHGKLWKSLMRAHLGNHEALACELQMIVREGG